MGQRFFPLLLFLLLIAGCARQNPGVEPAQSPVAAVATATAKRRPVTPVATASTPADTATPAQTPVPSLTPTLAPSATRTPRPSQTFTPTPTLAIWVEVGTPMPGVGQPITPQNVTQITELARWGRGVIADIDLSADGRWLAVAAGSAVYIHETPEMTIPPRVVAATDTVSSIAISPTGERVAFADRQGLQVWQLEPLRLLFARNDVWEPQFSPDGSVVAGIGRIVHFTGRRVVVLDSESGAELASHPVPDLSHIRFSPGGSRIAVWSEYHPKPTVSVYDWQQNRLVAEHAAVLHPEPDQGLEVSPQVGDVVFLADDDLRLLVLEEGPVYVTSRIEVQDVEGTTVFSNRGLSQLVQPESYACNEPYYVADPPGGPYPGQLQVTADGRIAGVLYDGGYGRFQDFASSLRFYDAGSGQLLYAVEEGIVDYELSPDGQTWVAGRQDGQLQIRRLSDGSVLDGVDGYEAPVQRIVVSPDSLWTGVIYVDEVKVLRRDDGAVAYRFPAREISFSPDESSFALGYEDGRIEIRALGDGTILGSIRAHQDRVSAIAYLPSGELLSAGFDCAITLWQTPGLLRIGALESALVQGYVSGEQVPLRVDSFLIMPDGQSVIGRFHLGDTFGVWRVEDGQLLFSPDPERPARAFAAAPTGSVVAVASYSRELPEPWDDGLTFVETEVSLVAFTPDVQLYAGIWPGEGLQLWQVAPRTLLHASEMDRRFVSAITFTGDGELLLTGTFDGVVRVWGIP